MGVMAGSIAEGWGPRSPADPEFCPDKSYCSGGFGSLVAWGASSSVGSPVGFAFGRPRFRSLLCQYTSCVTQTSYLDLSFSFSFSLGFY